MNHLTDFVVASVIVTTAVVGTMFAAQPRPKPEPLPEQIETTQESLRRCEKHPERMCVIIERQPVVRVEPLPTQTPAQQAVRVERIEDRAKEIQQKLDRIEKKAEAEK